MRIVYDATLGRPGCAILQAAMGGDSFIANRFPVEEWLVAPSPGEPEAKGNGH